MDPMETTCQGFSSFICNGANTIVKIDKVMKNITPIAKQEQPRQKELEPIRIKWWLKHLQVA